MTIKALIDEFMTKLTDHIETEARRAALAAIDGIGTKHTAVGVIRHVHPGGFVTVEVGKRPRTARHVPGRRKGPIQFCPVPGCAMRAAPVFGMVCAGHKNVPKAKIAVYREARRAAKAVA